jgi:predicted dehydrogenase
MNQAPHSLDQFLWIGGQPKSVQAIATTRLHNIEVENTALAICDYGGGKVGSFYATTAEAGTGERMDIVGDKGALLWSENKLRRLQLSLPVSEHLATEKSAFGQMEGRWTEIGIEDDEGDHHRGVHRAFAQAVRANDPSLMIANGEDGVRALEFSNAILLAGYTRREMKLPIDADEFEAMLEKLQSGAAADELRQD